MHMSITPDGTSWMSARPEILSRAEIIASGFFVSSTAPASRRTPMELMYMAHANFRPHDHARLEYSAQYTPEHVRVRTSIPSHVKPAPGYTEFLAELAAKESIDLACSSVRMLVVAGEPGGTIPATRQRIEEVWGARVFDHYGMTEIGPVAVVRGNHRQAGDAAFSRLGLQQQRHARAATPTQGLKHGGRRRASDARAETKADS